MRAHHRCRIFAGLRWFWECYSSGSTSVRSPVCCLWRGRPSLCTSGRIGTSLKWSERWREMKCLVPSLPPHAPSVNEPCESDKDAIIRPTTKLIWTLLGQHNKHLDTKNDGYLQFKPNFHEPLSKCRAAVDLLLWTLAGNHRLSGLARNENHTQTFLTE